MRKKFTYLICILILCSCATESPANDATDDYWSKYLSNEVTVEGIALNAKMGAFIQSPDPSNSIWVDSLSHWPEEYFGNNVQVTGFVIVKYDLPVFIPKEGEPLKTGIPVPEGTDLHEASKRFLLKNAKWKLLK